MPLFEFNNIKYQMLEKLPKENRERADAHVKNTLRLLRESVISKEALAIILAQYM